MMAQETTASRLEQWNAIMSYSTAMVELADSREWEALLKLETERRERLESFFALPVDEALAQEIATGLRQMLAVDKRLLELGQTGKDELAGLIKGLHTGHKAQRAYAKHS
ncbi:MAG: flagellar protein FliT [Gammaproteobacteria bacterium]|nr:flagellar protein FliT [Gammaproteobacteria bacterium]